MSQKKATPVVEEFIANHRHEMSVRELAESTGVSKTTVSRVIRKLGLDPDSPPPQGATLVREDGIDDGDRLSRLRQQARVLRRAMPNSGGSSLAALSKEYRETLLEIEMLEKAEGTKTEKNPPEEANPFIAISSKFSRPREAASH